MQRSRQRWRHAAGIEGSSLRQDDGCLKQPGIARWGAGVDWALENKAPLHGGSIIMCIYPFSRQPLATLDWEYLHHGAWSWARRAAASAFQIPILLVVSIPLVFLIRSHPVAPEDAFVPGALPRGRNPETAF
ncbi:hypothetical protein VTH06DRAFT_812 [Thermothelomyces fergusii]